MTPQQIIGQLRSPNRKTHHQPSQIAEIVQVVD
jgi:hypothetical protein